MTPQKSDAGKPGTAQQTGVPGCCDADPQQVTACKWLTSLPTAILSKSDRDIFTIMECLLLDSIFA